MRHSVLQRASRLKPTKEPPPGAKVVGYTKTADGAHEPIYEETVQVTVDKVPRRDPENGKVIRRVTHPNAMPAIQFEEIKEERTRQFVLIASPTGKVSKQYTFAPDEEQVAQQERQRKVEDVKDKFAERLVASGMDLDSLLDKLLGNAEEPAQGNGAEGAEEPPFDLPEAAQRIHLAKRGDSFGWWDVFAVGEDFKVMLNPQGKALREDDANLLAAAAEDELQLRDAGAQHGE